MSRVYSKRYGTDRECRLIFVLVNSLLIPGITDDELVPDLLRDYRKWCRSGLCNPIRHYNYLMKIYALQVTNQGPL